MYPLAGTTNMPKPVSTEYQLARVYTRVCCPAMCPYHGRNEPPVLEMPNWLTECRSVKPKMKTGDIEENEAHRK